MHIVSAYSPTTFSKPCLVYESDDCDESGGGHITGHWASALNGTHAIGIVFDSDGRRKVEEILERPVVSEPFEVGRFSSWEATLDAHMEMNAVLQNGKSNEVWSAGMGLYDQLYERFYKGVPK